MTDFAHAHLTAVPTDADVVDAALLGGPATLPAEARHSRVTRSVDRIKVRHCGGYEHFARTDREPAVDPVVFHWVDRTRIAE